MKAKFSSRLYTLFVILAFSTLGLSSLSPEHAEPTKSKTRAADVCAYEPKAKVSDACASYAYLDDLNDLVHAYVSKLVTKTDFFSYYRLNLFNKKCPFWSDENGLCGNIACSVTTLENEEDVPKIWRAAELSKLEGPKAHHPGKKEQRERPQKPLQGELGANVGESCVVEYDDECDERDYCVPEDERATAKGDYVSLVDNPERFTGYTGPGAQQVWDAIYRENCFSKPAAGAKSSNNGGPFQPFGGLGGQPGKAAMDLKAVMQDHGRQQAMQRGSIDDQMEFDDQCIEKRVFYRVISGMHASISTHLCYNYLNQTTGQWGPNLQCYKERLHNYPERISNLYFNYALVLRAVGKLKDHILHYTFCTGDPVEDQRTKQLVHGLAQALPGGPELFDESILFQENPAIDSGITLKEDFRNRFRNISRIMDCVGCDKCRLWGKLQTAGYGTALKVLFELGNGNSHEDEPILRRTELVALMNTLDKISHALKALEHFRQMMVEEREAASSSSRRLIADDIPGSGQQDFKPKTDREPIDEPPSLADQFWFEWNRIWKVFWIVLTSWMGLPGQVWVILLSELARAWNFFIGLPVGPRTWEVKWPELDEL
ncbi:endoplasmic reticulum oxidoreductin ERO1 [Elsinoe australis]|uniref:Endoplasmic reticulum oxidoreductin ERO1 n=1 Tax=Elsinoe australis TaxID=40998 RepID=A0A4U7B733_9PEZI|nr:endoplasmic reticulum oxidoreductin ERO1 [Elsinoe australis]